MALGTATNSFTGLVSPHLTNIWEQMIDSIVAESGCSVPCRIIYDNTKCFPCTNCLTNVSTKRSAGIYRAGGPYPFKKGGICPMCAGQGILTFDSDEDNVRMMVIWDQKQFYNFGRGQVSDRASNTASAPLVFAQTLSQVGLYHKLMKAKEVVLNTDYECIDHSRFKRMGKPDFCGIGKPKYVIFTWQSLP